MPIQLVPSTAHYRLRILGLLAAFVVCCMTGGMHAAWAATDSLQVYFIDVEGGQATLFVTPAGQSLLIDTGWAGHNGRDADRIAAAAKIAGIHKIDYLLLTHFHDDHVGGVPQLVERIPVGTFIDHGTNRELTDAVTVKDFAAYQKVFAGGHYGHIVPKPGDILPIPGMKVQVISADGDLIKHPLPGGGLANPDCKASENRPPDQTENARSLGVLITFGGLRVLDLGDLTWDKEMQLMCPSNPIGRVDILVVSHHGWYQSSSPALVDAVQSRVAVMDNGETKGGSVPTLRLLKKAPGLETVWQIHFSAEGGQALNPPAEYIANPSGPDAGHYLKLTVHPNGSFTIFNSRTAWTKDYATKANLTGE